MRSAGSLYACQFIALASFPFGLAAVRRAEGVPPEQLGLLHLIALVSVVKLSWAPLVDRFGSRRLGHYRSWFLTTRALIIVGVLALSPARCRR